MNKKLIPIVKLVMLFCAALWGGAYIVNLLLPHLSLWMSFPFFMSVFLLGCMTAFIIFLKITKVIES